MSSSGLDAIERIESQPEKVFTPPSPLQNSIGFQELTTGHVYYFPAGIGHTIGSDYILAGTMNIGLTNVFVDLIPLTNANGPAVSQVITEGNVSVDYDFKLGAIF
jgi:hypothetical protein